MHQIEDFFERNLKSQHIHGLQRHTLPTSLHGDWVDYGDRILLQVKSEYEHGM